MTTFTATINAVCPVTGKLKFYQTAIKLPCQTIKEANQYAQTHYIGYMKIDGYYITEIPSSQPPGIPEINPN